MNRSQRCSRLAALVVLASTLPAMASEGVITKNPMFQAKGTSGTNPLNVELISPTPNPATVAIQGTFDGQQQVVVKDRFGNTPIVVSGGSMQLTGVIGAGQISGITGGAVAGIVVARTTDTSSAGAANTGVFVYHTDGSPRETLSTSSSTDPTFAPSVSRNGNIVFKDIDTDGDPVALYARNASGSQKITIQGGDIVFTDRPAISNSMVVAVKGQKTGEATRNLYVKIPGRANMVTVPMSDSLRIDAGSRVSVVDGANGHSDVGFMAINSLTGQRELLHSVVDTTAGTASLAQTLIAGTAAEPLSPEFSVSVDSSAPLIALYFSKKGYDSWKAHSDMGATNTNTNPSMFVGVGDQVGNSRVASVKMFEGSALDDGSAMMFLTLEDGSSDLYLVSVPEPTTAMLLALPALMLRRRK